MALPRLNDKPKYEVDVPSLGKTVRYRPFLVKEEKVLLLAMESKDANQILSAIADTVLACVVDDLDINKLTTFDIEYLFLKIRTKSVGERAPLLFNCTNCGEGNEVVVNVDEITMNAEKPDGKVVLSPEYSLKMKWPTYNSVANDAELLVTQDKTSQAFALVIKCIDSIISESEKWVVKDEPIEDVIGFLESLTSEQYAKITEFMESIPALQHTVEYDCSKCGTHNKYELKGINDFF